MEHERQRDRERERDIYTYVLYVKLPAIGRGTPTTKRQVFSTFSPQLSSCVEVPIYNKLVFAQGQVGSIGEPTI